MNAPGTGVSNYRSNLSVPHSAVGLDLIEKPHGFGFEFLEAKQVTCGLGIGEIVTETANLLAQP